MSETLLFVIGILVFLITVYGAVVAGGIALTDRQLDEEPHLDDGVPDEDRKSFLMNKVEY